MLLCTLLLAAVTASAADRVVDAGNLERGSVILADSFAVLEDPNRTLTLDDVRDPATAARFVPARPVADALSFGFTGSAYWLRLNLRNTQDHAVEPLLEIRYPILSHIELHQLADGGSLRTVTTGAATPFATRPYPNRFFVIPLALPPHSTQTVYLRIESVSSLLVPATLWAPQAFHARERDDYAGQTWYFGMAAAIILFNLLLFVALRDRVYLLYVVFVTFSALTIAAGNGFGHEFLWPDAARWSNVAINNCGSLTLATLLLLMRHMLDTRHNAPRLDRLVRAFIPLQLVFAIAFFLAPRPLVGPSFLLLVATQLLILATGLFCACVKRQKIAVLFMIAVGTWMLGVFVVSLKTVSLLPANFLTMNGYQIGSTLEMMLLAFVLAYRFNLIRRQATELVEQTNANLEVRLQQREAELKESHERLREIEHREILRQERQRLMQDMHDGMGSALASALRVVERGRIDSAEIAHVLKGCIEDLKLTIDSMEPVDADLLLLAMLRFRLGSRLEQSGISLHWGVQDIPALDWLDPQSSLHILRILQEAFTNIIKHANATQIHLSTVADAEGVTITVADNGQGFVMDQALAGGGRGLATQLRRAQAIGATVNWESDTRGSRLSLRLPLARLATECHGSAVL